jgi:hypothetical protein
MKPSNILFTLIVLCFTASCNSNQNLKNENTSNNKTMENIISNSDCFDEKMERWFITFNKLQDEGADMNKANMKALNIVENEFKLCGTKNTDNRLSETHH